MKRNTILLYTLISIAFVVGSINAGQSMKSKITQKGDNTISKLKIVKIIGPNVNDVQKLVKPLIQAPYKPVEVDSLYQSQQNENRELEMQSAEILGDVARAKGLVEKPVLYDTVITSRSTSVAHANQINALTQGTTAGPNSQAMFQSEAGKLAQGQLAIPVKIQSSSRTSADNNYETPVFIHKEQKELNNAGVEDIIKVPQTPMVTPVNLAKTIANDAKAVKDSLSAAKTYKEKVEACKFYKFIYF